MASNANLIQANETLNVNGPFSGSLDKALPKNKSESNLVLNEEVKRHALSPARKKELLEMAVSAFMNKYNRVDMEHIRENKWHLWKYRDQIAHEEKRRNKWLQEAEADNSGYAIGRRIFDKAEIVVYIYNVRTLGVYYFTLCSQ